VDGKIIRQLLFSDCRFYREAKMVVISSEKGFSLLEVMIALTLFAVFVTAYITSQSYNVEDSRLTEEQLLLQQLAERKINELVLDPPKFSNATANLKETKPFNEEEFKNYEYTLEIKRLTIPDFAQLFAQKNGASSEAQENYDGDYFAEGAQGQRNTNIEKMVFEELRKNIERILWQARVTVTNKETKYSFSLSTFITNYNERVQLNVGF
jgi:prepilin-type N-terminal cleavage/methylation domain-containing protein